tara:strand:- start:6724 stop:7518 length:795 start_codon:yes stop_codon:yes gene_type:complete
MSNNEVATLYNDVLTEQGLEDLRAKYPSNLVYDMTDDGVFKSARLTRTERNKLNEAIDRRRIDKAAEVNTMGNSLTEKVNDIYSVIVEPFEAEAKKRKLEAKRIAELQQKIIDDDRAKINGLRGFIGQAYSGDSANASSLIDAVTNIDPTTFHKDLIVEAKQAKESVLSELGNILASKLQTEATEKQNKALQDQLAELKAAQPEPVIDAVKKHSGIDVAQSTTEQGGITSIITIQIKGTQAHIDKVCNEIDMLLTRISPSSQIK